MSTGLLVPSMTQSAIATTTLPTDKAVVAISPYLFSTSESSELRMATQLELATPHYQKIAPIYPTCITGHCTFPEFTTLAICSNIVGVTHMLTFGPSGVTDEEQSDRLLGLVPNLDSWSSDLNISYPSNNTWQYSRKASLPTRAYLIGGLRYLSLNVTYSSESDSFDRLSHPRWNHSKIVYPAVSLGYDPNLMRSAILNFFVIWINQAYFDDSAGGYIKDLPPDPDNYLDGSFRAAEVLLCFCVKTVNTSVSNGSPETNLSSTPASSRAFEGLDLSEPYNYTITTMPSLSQAIASETFFVDEGAFGTLFYYLRRKLRGTFSFTRNPAWSVRGQTPSSEMLGDAVWSSGVSSQEGIDGMKPEEYLSVTNQDRVQESRLQNMV